MVPTLVENSCVLVVIRLKRLESYASLLTTWLQLNFQSWVMVGTLYVTVSGKTSLIAHLKVSRNVGFKYSACCSWPMVVAKQTKFSHVLQPFLPS